MKNTIKNPILSILILIASIHIAFANDFNLPDLGTPSDSVLSPVKEKEIRDAIINQIYQYDLVMLDPIIFDYIEQLGFKLALNSENPQAPFDFFLVNENLVNASTYPGGLILIYSGLFLKTETESELAGVVAHEIAHATQRHMSRFYAHSKKNTLPMILGLLGAALAAQHSNSPDAPIAIATATTALQQQSAINFTRSHEYEADRVGIDTLNKTGFNPLGMAGFFEKLMRETPVDKRYQLPEYLRTHPLSINRVSEAKNRASSMKTLEFHESKNYQYIKERIRVLTKNIELDHIKYYENLIHKNSTTKIKPAELYGYALSLFQSHQYNQALSTLDQIQINADNKLLLAILKAQINAEINLKKGLNMFSDLLKNYPDSPLIIQPYIQTLSKTKNFKNNKKARLLARKLVQLYPDKPNFYQLLAVSNQNLGKTIEANEALAVKEHRIHNNYKAVRILKNILKKKLDYYQRSRIESKITEYENLITKKERQFEIQQEQKSKRRG